MNTQKLTDIIVSIVGKEAVNRDKKAQIKALLDTIVIAGAQATGYTKKGGAYVMEPNSYEKKNNEVNLADAAAFKFPQELNIAFEGEEATRKITILPDGISAN